MAGKPIAAVLLDVGGTLWPDTWPSSEPDRTARFVAVRGLVPAVTPEIIAEIFRRLDTSAEAIRQDTDATIAEALQEMGLPVDRDTARAIRKALCVRVAMLTSLFPDVPQLLAVIKELGLRCVILSNAVVRDSEQYRRDFEDFGVADHIDAIISSVDVRFRKPHPAIFQAAITAAGCSPHQCIMVGNSERNDVEPASSLGMRAIRVAIEEPVPAVTKANAVATSLQEVADIVRFWVTGHRRIGAAESGPFFESRHQADR